MTKTFKGLVLGLAVLLATGAFAASKGTLQLTDPVTISGKPIAAGDYSIKWEGTGDSVQVSILQGKNVVATTPARVVDLSKPADNNSAVLRSNADGSKSLTAVRFSGKKFALAIGEEAVTASGK